MKVQQQLHMLLAGGSKEIQKLQVLLPHATSTPCLDWDQMPDAVRFLVEDMLDAQPPQKSLCHDNCFRLCAHFKDVQIHTGYVMAPFLIEHSWCSIEYQNKRYYFDPTDLAHFHGTHFKDHFQLCSLDKNEAFFWAHALEHTGPFHHAVAGHELEKQNTQLTKQLHKQRPHLTPTDSAPGLTFSKKSTSSKL